VTEKTIAVSYRVSSRFKNLLEAAAAQANRSRTNMLEHLLYEYCKREGIEAPPFSGARNALDEVAS
jgi:predicted transcriptional regulator